MDNGGSQHHAAVLAARDSATKAVVKGWDRAHKCQFLQLR